MAKNKLVSLLLLAAMLTTVSCGDSLPEGNDDIQSSDADSTTAAAKGYSYPDKNFDGKELTILNYSDMWECTMALDFAEQTAERLDDAIYSRNRKVEDKLGFKLVETAMQYPGWSNRTDSIDIIMQNVISDDQTYDTAYVPVSFKPALMTEGYLYDLYELPGLNLDEEWWDQNIVDSLAINGKLFAVTSPLHLMAVDMSWVMLFNQDMMDDLKLEYPYQLVKDGNWTLDKFSEYVKNVVQLNGDDGFQPYSRDGNAVYGIAHHTTSFEGFIYAAGNQLITRDGDEYTINLENEHLYNTLDKLYEIFDKTNGNREGGTDASLDNLYYTMFRENRAMFLTCELKTASVMRDMNDTFGLLPYPKYDENQDSYYTLMNASSCVLTVPSNIEDPEFVGITLDALSYESLQSVLPEYYDVSLSQKGLRNEESIEMLDIIRSTRGIEFSRILGITSSICSKLISLQDASDKSYASTIASNKSIVAENLEKILNVMS